MQRKQLVLLLVVLLQQLGACGAARDHHRPAQCSEPSDKHLERQLKRLGPTGSLGIGAAAAEGSLLVDGNEDVRKRSCPHGTSGGKDLQGRSVSPWSFTVNQDFSRYPRRIREAYCLCDGCLLGNDGREDHSVKSELILTSILVLRRTKHCYHGRYVYKPDLETVPLFCTCSAQPSRDHMPTYSP